MCVLVKILYMNNNNNEPVDSSQYNIKWSTKTDNTGFQEWDDKVNFRSFVSITIVRDLPLP